MNKTMKKPMSFMSLRKKLFSAAAMLLVASIMLVSTSYAWLVLSTAPEVTGVTTQMGANGALEIVLLDTKSYNDLTQIAEADIDESVTGEPTATELNLQWGNLINLDDDGKYGLSKVILNPSRLAITPSGNDAEGNAAYLISDVLLKTPVYNEDGRIVKLEQTAVSSVYTDNKFPVVAGTQNYGVRAIGVAANMSEAQMGVNSARTALTNYMAEARTKASKALTDNGGALGGIAMEIALSDASTFDVNDIAALQKLAQDLDKALTEIENAIRQMYIGYIYTRGYESEQQAQALEAAAESSLTVLRTNYPGATVPDTREGVTGDIIDLLVADQLAVDNAIAACQAEIDSPKASYQQGDITGIMDDLVDYNKMTLAGYTVAQLQAMGSNTERVQAVMSGGNGFVLSVPSGSGILSDIADYAKDYTATVTMENVTVPGFGTIPSLPVQMATATTVSNPYLPQCNDLMLTFEVVDSGNSGSVITDFYGYAIDMAFRVNASNSNLLLQTDSAQRIYDESTNAATQGGGSYMEYEPKANLSYSKMIKLMSGIRVVFMDKTKSVLAIAALDTTLEQDDYVLAVNYGVKTKVSVGGTEVEINKDNCTNYKATIAESEYTALDPTTTASTVEGETMYTLGKDAYTQKASDTEKYAVLKGVAAPQNSDYISKSVYDEKAAGTKWEKDDYTVLPVDEQTEENYAVLTSTMDETTPTYITKAIYDALNDTNAVTIDPATGKIKAKLYLHDFEMVVSEAEEHKDSTETHYTGAIKIKEKLDSAAITALEENVPKQVTAMVYLDGSVVNNSMVAAEGGYSMTGILNLQFASDVMLTPMNNQALFDGEEEEQVPTEIINEE